MIKLISIFLLLIALFLEAAESSKKEIVLLHTNDIESVYDPVPAVWRADMELIGGISHLATLIRDVRAKENISFLVDAGDIFTGALSKKSEGKLPFDLYSAMNYDVLTLGNHEFEYGWETLVETIPRANFPVLNANIVREASGTLIAQPYTILKKNGIKVGVIGVMGIDAFYNTMASFHRTGLTIKDPTETVQYWADKIRDDVNMIIVLTHQNKTAPMQTNKESDPSVQRAIDEEYAMAERGRRMAPFMAQSKAADERRLKNRMQQMEEVYPTTPIPQIDLALQDAGLTQQETGMTYPELQDYIKKESQMQAIADAGGVANMAGGGIAKMAGDRSGAMLTSMNPDSQGLSYLFNRVKKV